VTAPALAIRPGHSDDADAMARLVHAGFAGYESFAPDWAWPRGAEEEADELRTRLGDDATWSAVAENGGEAIGFVLVVPARTSWRAPLDDDTAHLRSLFVDAAYQGTGLASRLLARAVAAAGREASRPCASSPRPPRAGVPVLRA